MREGNALGENAKAWRPREGWDALVRGEGCPLCAEVAAVLASADEYAIADLAMSRLWLAENQWIAGYCVLVCTRHVREPYELPREECERFFEDLMQAARAIERVLQPAKMNFEILGNAVPPLHCHIIPRYYGDPAPGRPINFSEQERRLSSAEAAARVQLLRSAL